MKLILSGRLNILFVVILQKCIVVYVKLEYMSMNYIAYVTNVYHYIYLSLGCLPQRGLLAMQRTKW